MVPVCGGVVDRGEDEVIGLGEVLFGVWGVSC